VRLLRHPALHLALRIGLGGFFLYASLDKIAAPADFARIVYRWQVLGPVPSNLVAVTLPWVEALCGLLLIAGVWRKEAAALVGLMLVVFIAAAASVVARGIDVENCGCVSVHGSGSAVGWLLIGRNLLLLAAAAVLALLAPAGRQAGLFMRPTRSSS
jgi:putative oxidoreductase